MYHTLSLQSNLTEMIEVEEYEQSYEEEDETQGQPVYQTLCAKFFQIAIGHFVQLVQLICLSHHLLTLHE